ncbi:MAG: Smr/MutS family protein [Alphaproteobacteria bacterium]|nr:Smr/MutS family protein [Alphaproteobacteria bacterium]
MARRPGSADRPPSPSGANDALLWRRVQESAKPLARRKPAPVFPPPEPAQRPEPAARPSRAVPRPVGPPPGAAPPPLSPHAAPGLDRSTHDKLRRGQLPIEAKLDLHGMDRERAHRALDQFMERAAVQGRRCVLVVTGKGGPKGPDGRPGEPGVLRSEVPRWLNEPPHRARLLAFCPAQPRHGGAGALYLLLKRRREP